MLAHLPMTIEVLARCDSIIKNIGTIKCIVHEVIGLALKVVN